MKESMSSPRFQPGTVPFSCVIPPCHCSASICGCNVVEFRCKIALTGEKGCRRTGEVCSVDDSLSGGEKEITEFSTSMSRGLNTERML